MLSSWGSLRMGRDLRLTTDRNLTLQHDRDLRHDKSDPGHLHGLMDRFDEEGGVDSTARRRSDCRSRYLATGPFVPQPVRWVRRTRRRKSRNVAQWNRADGRVRKAFEVRTTGTIFWETTHRSRFRYWTISNQRNVIPWFGASYWGVYASFAFKRMRVRRLEIDEAGLRG